MEGYRTTTSVSPTQVKGPAIPELFLPPQQLELLASQPMGKDNCSSTFAENLSLPVHSWFRYSAGFSALWVREVISQQIALGRRRILDPFAGSGTVLLECERFAAEAKGIEAHPFILRVAKAKLYWRITPQTFYKFAVGLMRTAQSKAFIMENYPPLIKKCFPSDALLKLNALKGAWRQMADGSPLSELAWITLASILRECSPVGTAQWQYVLPKKNKARAADPFDAFQSKVQSMCIDMFNRQQEVCGPRATAFPDDARKCSSIPDGWADLVITSPPYANNYDYADATRLEMCFFGEIRGWGDLQDTIRKYLVRSCTQHVAKLQGETYKMINDPILDPIQKELTETCKMLESEREKHGGKKPYHTMIAAYFSDMAKVWLALRRVTSPDSLVCFVVGDSAPYGIYVPVDRWLGELAVAAGFKSYVFEKTRDRNVKWKNRKHNVPLQEGRLLVA